MLRQTGVKPKRSPWRARMILLLLAAILLVTGFVLLMGNRGGTGNIAMPIKLDNVLASHELLPFGNDILHYDGITLYCRNAGGGLRWSFQIGQGAGFHTNGKRVVAWSVNQLYVINSDGRATYNDRMADTVQFARVGNTYTAIFHGQSQEKGTITVIDRDGMNVDSIDVNGTNMLDIGFFSEGPEMMWTLGLVTTGTVPSNVLMTFEPNKTITGNSVLGEELVYRVAYHNNRLVVVDTRQIRSFNYQIKEDSSILPVLIYGWYLQDMRQVGRDLVQLFTPAEAQDGALSISDMRLLIGENNRVIHPPSPCVGAVLGSKAMYGFARNQIYMCRYGDTFFSAVTLPIQVTRVIGVTQGDCAIVAENNDVYLVQLP